MDVIYWALVFFDAMPSPSLAHAAYPHWSQSVGGYVCTSYFYPSPCNLVTARLRFVNDSEKTQHDETLTFTEDAAASATTDPHTALPICRS